MKNFPQICRWASRFLGHDWLCPFVSSLSHATPPDYRATDAFFPEWHVWEDFAGTSAEGAISLDSLQSTHPIEVVPADVALVGPAGERNGGDALRQSWARFLVLLGDKPRRLSTLSHLGPNESRPDGSAPGGFPSSSPLSLYVQPAARTISECEQVFDAISYSKGALLVRMAAALLGDEAFVAGLRHYLTKHARSCASSDDLWTAIAEACPLLEPPLPDPSARGAGGAGKGA